MGIFDGIVGDAISGAAAIGGGILGFMGQKATNANNVVLQQQAFGEQQQLNQAQMDYNTDQAGASRAWSSMWNQASMEFNQAQAREAMAFTDQQRRAQDDFAASLSNTAYQRSVADMRKAGLNPILGVASGGASTPTPSSPSGTSASASNMGAGMASMSGSSAPAQARVGNSLGEGINSALSALGTVTQLRQANASIEKQRADTANVEADTNTKVTALPGVLAEVTNKQLTSAQIKQQTDNLQRQYDNLVKQGYQIDANTAAAVAAASRDYSAANLSAAQAAISRWSLDFRNKYGAEPTTSGVATGQSVLEALGNRAAGNVGKPPSGGSLPGTGVGGSLWDFLINGMMGGQSPVSSRNSAKQPSPPVLPGDFGGFPF